VIRFSSSAKLDLTAQLQQIQFSTLQSSQPHHNGSRSKFYRSINPYSSSWTFCLRFRILSSSSSGRSTEAVVSSSSIIANVFSFQRSAALKLDWAKVTTSLGLRGQTVTSLQAFKKRNEDARRRVTLLSEQSSKVDFAHYRSILKNQAVVDEIEKHFNSFKPATYDVGRQIKAIEAFEAQALKNAEETKGRVDLELKDLEKTLKNIEEARPFDELTVVCFTG
jgi:F-type H+-transporting ATPase subunit d